MGVHVGVRQRRAHPSRIFEAAKYSEVAVFAELHTLLAAPLRNAFIP